MQVKWQAYPKQIAFFNTTEKEVLYGGAAGGGKSIGQVMDAFIKAAQYPGMAQLILRSTYEELEKSILRDVDVMYPASVWNYNKSSHTGRIGKSIIDFGYLASDKDLRRYQSAHYDIIRFDELTHFTEYQYTYMMSRVRGDNNFPKQIKSTTNPGSVGHAWVKKRFVTAAEPNKTFSVDGRTRIFIPAKVQDNLFLMKSNPEYIEWLEQLPEHQKQALLYGNWDIFEGQYFTEYSYRTHVIPRDRWRYRRIGEDSVQWTGASKTRAAFCGLQSHRAGASLYTMSCTHGFSQTRQSWRRSSKKRAMTIYRTRWRLLICSRKTGNLRSTGRQRQKYSRTTECPSCARITLEFRDGSAYVNISRLWKTITHVY